MKRFFGFAAVLVLCAAPMFGAGSSKPQNVVIPQTVQVGSTKIPAGNYKLAWTGTGSNVQCTLTQSGKTILTFAAKAVDAKNNEPGVDLLTKAGITSLQAIYLNKLSLQLQDAPAVGQ